MAWHGIWQCTVAIIYMSDWLHMCIVTWFWVLWWAVLDILGNLYDRNAVIILNMKEELVVITIKPHQHSTWHHDCIIIAHTGEIVKTWAPARADRAISLASVPHESTGAWDHQHSTESHWNHPQSSPHPPVKWHACKQEHELETDHNKAKKNCSHALDCSSSYPLDGSWTLRFYHTNQLAQGHHVCIFNTLSELMTTPLGISLLD